MDAAAGTATQTIFHMCTNLGDSLSLFNRATKRRKIVAAAIDVRIAKYSRWHELSVDLMEMISDHTDATDRVRMSVVCKSWELIIKQKDIRVPQQLPWLMLSCVPKDCKKTVSFYDISHGRVHNLKLPKPIQGGCCIGSSKGWLVFAKGKELFLLNPLSGVRHKLPSLATVPYFNDQVLQNNNKNRGWPNVLTFIDQVELSSEDPLECTVATTFDCCGILGCCRPKDKSWIIFQDDDNLLCYGSILFVNETLYVMRFQTEPAPKSGSSLTAATYTMQLEDHDHQVTLKLLPDIRSFSELQQTEVNYLDHFAIHLEGETHSYLIELDSDSGKLLLVTKQMDLLFVNKDEDHDQNNHNVPDLRYHRSSNFEVFKLSPDENDSRGTSFSISRMESLGDGILYLSHGGCSYFPSTRTRHHLHGIRGNCIYFADDLDNYDGDCDPYVSRETGVFYLDDKKIQRPFPSSQLPLQSWMCWFTPNLFS